MVFPPAFTHAQPSGDSRLCCAHRLIPPRLAISDAVVGIAGRGLQADGRRTTTVDLAARMADVARHGDVMSGSGFVAAVSNQKFDRELRRAAAPDWVHFPVSRNKS